MSFVAMIAKVKRAAVASWGVQPLAAQSPGKRAVLGGVGKITRTGGLVAVLNTFQYFRMKSLVAQCWSQIVMNFDVL